MDEMRIIDETENEVMKSCKLNDIKYERTEDYFVDDWGKIGKDKGMNNYDFASLIPDPDAEPAELSVIELPDIRSPKQKTKKWEEYGLLEGVAKDKKTDVACALENQRLFNDSKETMSSQFKRISIPLVYKIFGKGKPVPVFAVKRKKVDYGVPVKFTSSVGGDWGEPHITDIEWTLVLQGRSVTMLDAEAERTAVLDYEIGAYIENWQHDHEGELDFKALDVIDGKIAIYGLQYIQQS